MGTSLELKINRFSYFCLFNKTFILHLLITKKNNKNEYQRQEKTKFLANYGFFNQ
jgi:hypothetical protein